MPRARLPQLQSITDGSFEPNRRNPILLGEDSFLDDHQKPIRIGESTSPLSLSKNQIRIDGDFHLEGKLANPLLTTDFEYLELRAEENIRFTSNNSTGSLDIFVSGGSPFYIASGSNMHFLTTNAGTLNFGSLGNVSMFTFDVINSKFQIQDADDSGDTFNIQTNTHGATDITTIDDDATAAHLVIDIDGDITLDAASGNITVKDNGGNYTPSSDYHVATKKYVDDNAGGGASALNDLSDVSYSSGDLSINLLDTIVAPATLTVDAGGDIVLDADGGDVFIKDNGSTLIQLTNNAIQVGEATYGNQLVQYDGDDLLAFDTEELTIFNYLKIAETANANADTAGRGQLWVKNDTPNNLYFTDDTGQDVQITNNGSLASAGGGGKTYLDWYYYQASLSNNIFYVSLHHDEFGVTSIANTNISDYNDTTAEDMWRIIRYAGKRVPYSGTVTKFMAHVESSGASADSDVEVGVWLASKPTLDTELASTTNMTIDNLGYMTFDFSSASRFLHKETTSFNATSVTQGDFMFITVRKTTGTDGTSFWIHSTVTMDIS
tara:strand:- start:5977 stop:7626 length:1650 start_codon:yes stop_codon:yes gene_type:complete